MLKKMALPFSFLMLLSCSPSSPKLEEKVYTESIANVVALDFSAKVDILFVIDDSGSMSNYQKNVSKNIDALVASIARNKILDYHVGVITTSMDEFGRGGDNVDGHLVSTHFGPKYIERSTPDGLKLLKQYVQVGTSGSSTEKFFEPVVSALSSPVKDNENLGFLRDSATLVLIVMSDAEDQSVDINGKDFTGDEFINFLINDVKSGDESLILPYGIIIPSSIKEYETCMRDTGPPLKYEKALKKFGGYEYNLCDKDFNASLDSLGKDIVKRISRVAYLNRRPVADTIVVKYDGKIITNDATTGWTYDPAKNAIVISLAMFQSLAGSSSKLDVSFTAANDIQ